MKEQALMVLDCDGLVVGANDAAARLAGIPGDDLVGQPLAHRVIAEHRARLASELESLRDGAENHGRIHCIFVGLDGIGRRLTLVMDRAEDARIAVELFPYQHHDPSAKAPGSALVDPGRFLPVARRVTEISRRAGNKEQLFREALEVLAEATAAASGAALEWRENQPDLPVATVGSFERSFLAGVFRPAILARLARGDVVVTEAIRGGGDAELCLVIVPMLSITALVGLIVLTVSGYSVLVPEEQQTLAILGGILGLGLHALATAQRRQEASAPHRGDREAGIALGRLSSGLSHEINNAVTVLRANIELMRMGGGTGQGTAEKTAVKDSLAALDVIGDLGDALAAFAPEETAVLEETDLLRMLDMAVHSIGFYAKRGLEVSLDRPRVHIPLVKARSRYLIRSFFLIFVELIESARGSGLEPRIRFALHTEGDRVLLTVTVAAGPVGLPSVLLRQLEKGGALSIQVAEAGGKLSHLIDHQGSLVIAIALPKAGSPDRRPSLPPGLPTRRGTILVADDEGAVIRSLRRVLQQDHDVLAARTGEEALRIIEANPKIDAVLYDISMPRLGAAEFYQALRKIEHASPERVIFVDGGGADAEVSVFLRGLDNPLIEKPFDLARLNELLSAILK